MIKYRKLNNRRETIAEIDRLSKQYKYDILGLSRLSVSQFFDYLRKLPYQRDIYPVEIVKRPAFIKKSADCKKKTILSLAYADINRIPSRIITISNRPNRVIHHVFPQFFLGGRWVNFDSTYSYNRLGEPKFFTNIEVYRRK